MTDFIRVLPCSATEPGERYRLERLDGESNCYLVEEEVWPEQVDNPASNHIRKTHDSLCLTLEHQRWLRDSLSAMLGDPVVGFSDDERQLISRALGCLSSDYNDVDHELVSELRRRLAR